jgi:hypothetical protein
VQQRSQRFASTSQAWRSIKAKTRALVKFPQACFLLPLSPLSLAAATYSAYYRIYSKSKRAPAIWRNDPSMES